METHVAWLADRAELVDTVIGWHWREWAHAYEQPSLDDWRDRLVSRSNRDKVPFTLVALVDDQPVGCVTVCDDDLDARFADHGPWISGMFVMGAARDQGVGRTLLHAAEQHARRCGANELWLFTSEAKSFYERCGWDVVVDKQRITDHAVMRRDL